MDLNKNPHIALFFQKMTTCGSKVLLVTPDDPDPNRSDELGLEYGMVKQLQEAWRDVTENPYDTNLQNMAWQRIDKIGETLPSGVHFKSSFLLRRFRKKSGFNEFFLLVDGSVRSGIPYTVLGSICNLWHMDQGRFPLHAAGIVHKDRLFAFLGPSGAGKSTIANLSRTKDYRVLDEDQLLVYRAQDNEYHADAWGYALDSCSNPLRGIFFLHKSKSLKLVPLSAMRCVRLLFERHQDIMAQQVPPALSGQAFRFFSELARKVNGFALHFGKNDDIWKHINEQLIA